MYITVVGLLRVVSYMGLYIKLIQIVLSQFELSRVECTMWLIAFILPFILTYNFISS